MPGGQTQPRPGHLLHPSTNPKESGSPSDVPAVLDQPEGNRQTTNYPWAPSTNDDQGGGSLPSNLETLGYAFDEAAPSAEVHDANVNPDGSRRYQEVPAPPDPSDPPLPGGSY